MAQFNLEEFEARVDALIAAYARLSADYRALQDAHENECRRTREISAELGDVIERIRALEAEAGNV